MFKKTLIASALALTAFGAQASALVNISYDGTGSNIISTSSLDWAPDSALVTVVAGQTNVITGQADNNVNDPYPGQVVQTYVQAALGTIRNSANKIVSPTGLNNTFEWTFVAGFQEQIYSIQGSPNPADGTVVLHTISGGQNFFNLYSGAADSDPLSGTGYSNGTLILSGSIAAYDSVTDTGKTSFGVNSGTTVVPLDGSGTNNYPTLSSVTGSGTGDVTALVSYVNNSYFTNLNVGDAVSLFLQTNLGLPFGQVDPSALVAGLPAANSSSIGSVNGISGPNLLLQSDAASNFQLTNVPEPASAALVGVALAGLGMTRRRSSK